MYTALLTLAIALACASLAMSVYLVAVNEARFFGMRYEKCPRCHHHYFASAGDTAAHECRSRHGHARLLAGHPR